MTAGPVDTRCSSSVLNVRFGGGARHSTDPYRVPDGRRGQARSTSSATLVVMNRIGVRELRQHASRYLDEVRAGKTIEVTDRGRLVALLVPPTPEQSVRDRLVAEGRVRPGAPAVRLPSRRASAGRSTTSVLDELRDDR